jgi:hypothetical protein
MGLALLPWERLPSWFLGPLIAILNIYLFCHEQRYSWRQVESGLFIVIGIVMSVYGVRKLMRELRSK